MDVGDDGERAGAAGTADQDKRPRTRSPVRMGRGPVDVEACVLVQQQAQAAAASSARQAREAAEAAHTIHQRLAEQERYTAAHEARGAV